MTIRCGVERLVENLKDRIGLDYTVMCVGMEKVRFLTEFVIGV